MYESLALDLLRSDLMKTRSPTSKDGMVTGGLFLEL